MYRTQCQSRQGSRSRHTTRPLDEAGTLGQSGEHLQTALSQPVLLRRCQGSLEQASIQFRHIAVLPDLMAGEEVRKLAQCIVYSHAVWP